jgi:hypothetical protein
MPMVCHGTHPLVQSPAIPEQNHFEELFSLQLILCWQCSLPSVCHWEVNTSLKIADF